MLCVSAIEILQQLNDLCFFWKCSLFLLVLSIAIVVERNPFLLSYIFHGKTELRYLLCVSHLRG